MSRCIMYNNIYLPIYLHLVAKHSFRNHHPSRILQIYSKRHLHDKTIVTTTTFYCFESQRLDVRFSVASSLRNKSDNSDNNAEYINLCCSNPQIDPSVINNKITFSRPKMSLTLTALRNMYVPRNTHACLPAQHTHTHTHQQEPEGFYDNNIHICGPSIPYIECIYF